MKSGPDRYGALAVSIHWLSAALILALLVSGFLASNATDTASKAALLRFHIPIAILIFLLTGFRIAWWLRFDAKPKPATDTPAWRSRLATGVHGAFYVVIFGMVASGVGMMVLSDAGSAVFGDPGARLPDFHDYRPRVPHGLGARLLVGLLLLHVIAALFHHFVLRDGLLRRIWFSR